MDEDTSTDAESTTVSELDSSIHDSNEEKNRREWCEFFLKKEGKVTTCRRYVRCKVCTNYPSVVALHSHRQ